jgi:hypothetical protein
MISFETVKRAKAFLCWDCYDDLSVQLIPVRESTAFYYPPAQIGSIVLFYHPDAKDFISPLCLLFHEAGHHAQYQTWLKDNRSDIFWERLHTPTGPDKIQFEKESWDLGRTLFHKFLQKEKMLIDWVENYNRFSMQQMKTYA